MFKKLHKLRIFLMDFSITCLLAYTLPQAALTVYGLGQARGQISIILKAEPIELLKERGQFTPTELEKIELIQQVKRYSVDSLFYTPSANYETYFDQKGKPLIWNVTACAPYELKDYEWNFPYLGHVSYKGYFDSVKATRERYRLLAEGWDTDLSRVSAWSTLGFFKDPVFSEMLKKHKGELAELMFHELFHGTIYAESSVDMNENLANFISRKATLQFLKGDSTELRIYQDDLAEEQAYDQFVFSCIRRLDSLYKDFKGLKLSAEQKKQKKSALILRFCMELESKMILKDNKIQRMKKRFLNSGNAYFMHFRRYDGLADSLERVLETKYKGRLPDMIKGLKAEIKSL